MGIHGYKESSLLYVVNIYNIFINNKYFIEIIQK